MSYACQQYLIDRITDHVPDFVTVTNSSFSPDDKAVVKKLPACVIVPFESIYSPPSLSNDFLIDTQQYEIHVILRSENNDTDHLQTEANASVLINSVLKWVTGFVPDDPNVMDAFRPIKKLRPTYFPDEGFASFGLIVSIRKTIPLL